VFGPDAGDPPVIGNGSDRRLLVVGLDGIPYRLIAAMTAKGVMPNLRDLVSVGCFRQMSSSIPEVSCVSWSSIITGENPGEHGIFGFTDLMPGGYGVRFPNYTSLAVPPFWERDPDRAAVIVNVPSTYPARPMNGVHIAGFVAPNLDKAVYPADLLPMLRELGYRIDVDSQLGHSSIGLFLEDLNGALEARIRVAERFWDGRAWSTFMLVFTGTDRLGHFLWDAYEDEDHPHHGAFLEHLSRVDEAIGRFVDRLGDRGAVVVLSDHGFERLHAEIAVNAVLAKHGYLRFSEGRTHLTAITGDSVAFALDPGRIYLHHERRFPRGGVSHEDVDRVTDELAALFAELKVEGQRVVRSIHRKEELYRGPLLDAAPDLVLVADEGFNLKAGFKATSIATRGPFAGKHSQPDAFLIARGAEDGAIPARPDVVDVVGIIEHMLQGG